MKQPNIARVATVLAGAAAAAAFAAGAQADAATVYFPQVPTLAHGGACWTNIQTWADTSQEWPGRAILNVRATSVQGVGPGDYPFAPLCEVRTVIAWRNMNTGAVGTYENNVVTGIYGSIQYSLFQDTGPGRIEVVVSTDTANVPARGSFDVPA
ncbi:hypothetical protein [Nocardia bovistercoris]|uniref:Secreted protein n=1 Tax=Nocardia bovistercoris TaxID=2785916 RepID=A0A931N2Z2_9NOCA|nr:hypothetical protein [Nocardia bovistercoris]MBH0776033.1 hypothetical protein [Nocardia bovistercoris]